MSVNTTRVPFMQFLRPNGERRPTSIDRPPDIVELSGKLIRAGYRFQIEELMTGQVSMTCSPRDEDEQDELGDLAHEICNNGPEVPERVDKLVRDAIIELRARHPELLA